VKRQPETKQRGGGRAFTMIELLVVIAIIAILAGLLLPAVIGGIKRAEITQAQTEVKLLAAALTSYLNDYSKFPGQAALSGASTDHTYTDYYMLIATLRGTNLAGTAQDLLGLTGNFWNNQNPRKKVYLQVSEKSIATNGTINTADATVATLGDLADPWGNRYRVVADWSMDGQVFADNETVFRTVAVWSWGSDTSFTPNSTNTAHVRSWR